MTSDIAKRGAQAAALVTQMALVTLLLGGLGGLADARLATDPFGLLLGLLGGFALGLKTLFTGLQRLNEDTDDHPPSDPPQ